MGQLFCTQPFTGLIRDFLFISVVGVQLGFAVVLGPIQLEDLECEVIFFPVGPTTTTSSQKSGVRGQVLLQANPKGLQQHVNPKGSKHIPVGNADT